MASDRKRRGIVGSLEGLSLPEIAQTLILGGKTARLTITCDGRWGHLWFVDGNLTHAVADGLRGELAVYELLRLTGGEFYIEHDVETHVRSIEQDSMCVLMEGARRLDEDQEQPTVYNTGRDRTDCEVIPLASPLAAGNASTSLSLSRRPAPTAGRSRNRFLPVALMVGTLAVVTTVWTFLLADHPGGTESANLAAPTERVSLEEATDHESSSAPQSELATAARPEDRAAPDASAIDPKLASRTATTMSPTPTLATEIP